MTDDAGDSPIETEKRHEAVFSKKPISVAEGDGVYLYDHDGNEYIDLGASYGVMAVGHSNPSVVEAVEEQSKAFTYAQASYATSERARLMERLVDVTPEPLDRVFLSNAGTEVNEAAMKFARASTDDGSTGVVAAKRGFHGRTFGSISATWKPKYKEPFEPLVPDFSFAGYNEPEELKQEVDDSTAMVILEPIQGEGGIYPAESDFLRTARDVCDDHDAYLVFDEIQAGLGRTGEMWSHEHYDVTPDALTTAKSLGGGLPISALVSTEEMTEIPSGSHGGTYCGNPIASAAARATLDYIVENDLAANAEEMGERLVEGVEDI
ncbi:MAG: aminotransferase class III-fold pyridoxal phosphate-dependent enzyme, partial [Halobacteria archaeon]|nr:aminotransferase class III-fold pyridoxal phosphate-dependent enzyme [Halobacteria archaeon]